MNKIWQSLVSNHNSLRELVRQSRKAISEAFLEYYKAEYPEKIKELEIYLQAEIIGVEHEENHIDSGDWADILTLKLKYCDNSEKDIEFLLYKSEYYDYDYDDTSRIDMTNKDEDIDRFTASSIVEILRHMFQEHPDVEVYYD